MLQTFRSNFLSLLADYRQTLGAWFAGSSWAVVNFAILKDATTVVQFVGAVVTTLGIIVVTTLNVFKNVRHFQELMESKRAKVTGSESQR